jgi:hypothetical protein
MLELLTLQEPSKNGAKRKKPIQQQLDEVQDQINKIQMQPVPLQDHSLEVNLISQYEQNLTKLTEFYRQRAKKHWATHGDRNTSFFHNAVLKRRRRNRIISINDSLGNNLFDPEDIAKEFVNYFRHIFCSSSTNNGRTNLDTNEPPQTQDFTNSVPDKQEVWEILKSMKRYASPGPDGFNIAFYIWAWSWIGDEVTNMLRSFYTTCIMPPHLNDTQIALIPKKLVCHLPSDFRPISLCNVIYKIIAKSLANRLKQHLPEYVHPSQQAFIQGRRISNNIVVAQEIAHSFSLTSWDSHDFMIKIDLAKAFDRLEWNCIDNALARKGIDSHFIKLVHACISTPNFSVMINGQSFGSFKSSRGIRQGCPLSPCLFVLAVNELSLALQDALQANHLTGISLGPNCPQIHSLMFADDLLLCGKANMQEAANIFSILNQFCRHSGQIPNWNKSGILFSKNVDMQTRQNIKQVFPVPDIDNHFVHLGHPLLLPAKDRSAAYAFIYDKFRSKLSAYKANRLSHAARLTLIKSVFSSIPVYYMSNILFSKKFLTKLTAIIRHFWWVGVRDDQTTKSLCLRAWADICIDKKIGGLGVRNLQAINQGLILSAAWRLAKEPHSQLAQILKAKYHHDTSIWRAKSNKPKSAFWAAILKVKPLLISASICQIVDGSSSIWSSPWFTGWENIYDHLIIQQHPFNYPAVVKDLWMPNRKAWNIDLISSLFNSETANAIIRTPIINSAGQDTLVWKLTPAGNHSSKSAYKHCFNNLHLPARHRPKIVPQQIMDLLNQVWKDKLMAPRVHTFAWRLCRDS